MRLPDLACLVKTECVGGAHRLVEVRAEHPLQPPRHPRVGDHPAEGRRVAAGQLVELGQPAEGGVGGTTLGTDAAVDVAGVARGATENAVCNGVSQLSDPLEGQVI